MRKEEFKRLARKKLREEFRDAVSNASNYLFRYVNCSFSDKEKVEMFLGEMPKAVSIEIRKLINFEARHKYVKNGDSE